MVDLQARRLGGPGGQASRNARRPDRPARQRHRLRVRPNPELGSKFAGTDCDADTFRYEEAVITSGSGASYTFADESYGEIGIGQMIRAVLDHADKPVKQVLNDRISRLQNPQNRGRL